MIFRIDLINNDWLRVNQGNHKNQTNHSSDNGNKATQRLKDYLVNLKLAA